MAAPITHIVLSEKIFAKKLSNFDKRDFLVGTSFPDIRYLGTISREKTHLEILPLDKLQNLDSFDAGMRFHALVDKVRETFLVSKNIYSYCPESKYVMQAVKFVEDKFLYNKIRNWDSIKEYFGTPLLQEINFNVGEDTIVKWHNLLKTYFSQRPDDYSIEYLVKEIGLPESVTKEITLLVKEIENKPQVIAFIEDLYLNFEDLLENYPV